MEDIKKAYKFDPSKSYQWEPSSKFLIEGAEFGIILNSLRQILNSPEAKMILLAEKASQMIENSLARAVDVGIAHETPDTKKEGS